MKLGHLQTKPTLTNLFADVLRRNCLALAVPGAFVIFALSLLIIPWLEWPAVLIYLMFFYVVALFLYRNGILSSDPTFPASLFLLICLAKILGTVGRYWMVVDLYDSSADALGYYRQGMMVADYFRVGDFSILETFHYKGSGTTWMVHLTGLVYTFFPASLPGSFFFFSALSFSTSVIFYRTHRVLFPQTSSWWYFGLIFLSPSMIFWPSSLGKEAWIIFCTGLTVWGAVQYLHQGRLFGLALVGIGMALIAPIRAHISAFLALAFGAAFLLRLFGRKQSLPMLIIGGILVLALAGVMVQLGSEFLGIEDLSAEAVQAEYEDLQSRELSGGSSFDPPNVFNPIGALYGIITIIFRPFPFEAHNAQAMITSLESLGWLALLLLRRRVLWERLRLLPTTPFLGFALVYTLILALGLTVSGNFGIVARQRVMFLPFFWMLFA
jgi:hypothetical protein